MEFDKEEQQIVYDALVHYQQYAEDISNGNHIENEICITPGVTKVVYHVISDKTIALMRRLYESWPNLIMH